MDFKEVLVMLDLDSYIQVAVSVVPLRAAAV
jgi:hypothetical protein